MGKCNPNQITQGNDNIPVGLSHRLLVFRIQGSAVGGESMDLGNRVVSRICRHPVSNFSSGTRLLRHRRDLDFFQPFRAFSRRLFTPMSFATIVNPTTPNPH